MDVAARNAEWVGLESLLKEKRVLSLVPEIAYHTRPPPVTEPFVLRVFELRGRFDLGPLADRIRALEYDLVVTHLAHRSYRGIEHLSPTLRDAIRSSYAPFCVLRESLFQLPRDREASGPLTDGLLRLGCTRMAEVPAVAEAHLVSPQLAVRDPPAAAPPSVRRILPLFLWGVILAVMGFVTYTLGVFLRLLSWPLDPYDQLLPSLHRIVWYSGVLVVAGTFLALVDLLLLLPRKRIGLDVRFSPVTNPDVTVALTAYNDEASIGFAVEDFRTHPRVRRVIVVDNNSTDHTAAEAEAAGAVVVRELAPGYGHCVWRALQEGSRYTDTDFTLLCEGDMTYRAYDIDKFLAYAPHADIVNGTRIVEQLRAFRTQLTTACTTGTSSSGSSSRSSTWAGGRSPTWAPPTSCAGTASWCGCCRSSNPRVNLEFNAHFLDTALGTASASSSARYVLRAYGQSKGASKQRAALRIGLRMVIGILFGWKGLARAR